MNKNNKELSKLYKTFSTDEVKRDAESLDVFYENFDGSQKNEEEFFLDNFYYSAPKVNAEQAENNKFVEAYFEHRQEIERVTFLLLKEKPHFKISCSFSDNSIISEGIIPLNLFFSNPEFALTNREIFIEKVFLRIMTSIILMPNYTPFRNIIMADPPSDEAKQYISGFYSECNQESVLSFHKYLKEFDFPLYDCILKNYNIKSVEQMEALK